VRRSSGVSFVVLFFLFASLQSSFAVAASFVAFESGQVRPLAMSPDGNTLFAVNTPDNRLEIFTITAAGLTLIDSVPVGMEPVAVAARNNNEVWVVNHLSDSISIVDVAANPPHVVRTLLVGDEPRDIVFAGSGGNRAFITTAHRGQNSPYTSSTNPGELTTPGIGRADVWVFDATALGASLGGNRLTIVTLFGDTPRALAVSADGSTVYAGVFHSGNQTTVLNDNIVCDGGASAASCTVDGASAPGGLPAPNVDSNNLPQPEVGLIVKYDGANWRDELGRNWSNQVRFSLPDKDVFRISANANPPVEIDAYPGVGTVLYNMAVSPSSGKLFVANTEAINEVRFEGTRTGGSTVSSVIGRQHETRITIIDPVTTSVTSRHLNKHIDYSVSPAPAGTAQKSLALPRQLTISADGKTLYVAAKGSDKVGIFDVAKLENNSFVPDSANHVTISGGGPAGIVLDEARGRLYVSTRFDNGVSIVDTTLKLETDHIQLANPEPASILAGRRFLYDANLASSNGEAACASCHVDGDLDSLSWDLGDPTGSLQNNPLDFIQKIDIPPEFYADFHPMKGPMSTQTLRGMDGHGSMHWRGDRTGGNDEPNSAPNGDGGSYNEVLAFKKFSVAFAGLLGRAAPMTDTEMQAFADFILQVLPPPNPIRNLDDSLTADQAAGQNLYFNVATDSLMCNTCHVVDPGQKFFGTNGVATFEASSQHMKIPQLRNMYSKVGMFGMPALPVHFNPGDNGFTGDQIRGFGFLHDGSTDTLLRFLNISVFVPQLGTTLGFTFPNGDADRRLVEQFVFAFDSNLKPVVGQQITLTDSNSAVVSPRINLLIARVAAGDADLVVKGIFGGEARGWRRKADATFESDKASEAALTDAALRALAQTPGQTLTYLAVPNGSAMRIGIDRDEDTALDGDDNCVSIANATQIDTDSDGLGNACDSDDDGDGLSDSLEISIGTNPLLVDTDGDTLSDGMEVGYDGDFTTYTPGHDLNPLSNDTDGDGLLDAVDPIPLTVNLADGDMNADGNFDAGDLLITVRIALGLLTTTNTHLAHGDLYPAGAPDGVINIQDLVLLQKLLLP